MGLGQQAISIDCDTQSVIFLEKNPTYLSNTMEIDIQYHFVRDMVLVKVDTWKNVEDALMNSVSTEKFYWCRETMGIAGLYQCLSSLVTPCVENKTTSGIMLGVCYVLSTTSFMHNIHPFVVLGAMRGSQGALPISGG